jgi:hypothetical protein
MVGYDVLLGFKPRKGTKRTRMVSMAYKEAAVSAAVLSKEPLSVRQLIGGQNVNAQAYDANAGIGSKQFAQRSQRDHCLQVFANARKLFTNTRILHLSCDGISAAGRHNDIFVVNRADEQIATVAPPKAA